MNALQLFRQGQDYIQIASHLNTTEAEVEVERQIHRLRRIERVGPYLTRRAEREAKREAARIKADRRAAVAIATVPKPPRLTEEQKAENRRLYRLRARQQLREIREAHRA